MGGEVGEIFTINSEWCICIQTVNTKRESYIRDNEQTWRGTAPSLRLNIRNVFNIEDEGFVTFL